LVLLLVICAALPVLTYPLWRDHGMYANIARWSILNGGTPYIDMWDIKPPPIYYLYALAITLFGNSTEALRALDFLLVPLGMAGLYWLGWQWRTVATGAWAALLYGVFYFTETYASLTQSDSLATVFMILAVVGAVRASAQGRGQVFYAFCTGALCGWILWFKHYYAFFVVALIFYHLYTYLRVKVPSPFTERGFRGEVSPLRYTIAAFTLGGVLVGGSLLAYFWSKGMVQEMLIIAQSTAAYNAQGYDVAAFLASMQNYLYYRGRHWGVLGGAVGLYFGVWAFQRFRKLAISSQPLAVSFSPSLPAERGAGGEVALSPLFWLWFLAGVAFLLIQAKGFDTHWLPMLPPLCLWGAAGIQSALAYVRRERLRQALIVLIVTFFLAIVLRSTWVRAFPYLSGQEDRLAYFARFDEGGDVLPAESLAVVQWLQPRLGAGDSIYIFGFRPEVAYMGGWRPATRYQAHFPVITPWYPHEWQQENVDILWAALPPYVLVLKADYMPWVTNSPADSQTLLLQYTELNNWLQYNYEPATEIGFFTLWQRRANSRSS
jgi:hypothetical protein